MGIFILKLIGYAIIAFFMSTIIHELGHVVCGLIHGWKFLMMVIGPFKFYRETPDDRIRFGIEKNPSLWGGCGGTFPNKVDDKAVKVFSRILLAGPIASFILGIVFCVILIVTKNELAMMIGFVALGEGVACILPMKIKTGILYNDGTRCMRIVKGGQTAAEEKAILTFAFDEFLHGTKDTFDKDMVEVLMDSEDAYFRYYGFYYTYRNAKHDGNEAEMVKMQSEMEALSEKVSNFIRQACVLE